MKQPKRFKIRLKYRVEKSKTILLVHGFQSTSWRSHNNFGWTRTSSLGFSSCNVSQRVGLPTTKSDKPLLLRRRNLPMDGNLLPPSSPLEGGGLLRLRMSPSHAES